MKKLEKIKPYSLPVKDWSESDDILAKSINELIETVQELQEEAAKVRKEVDWMLPYHTEKEPRFSIAEFREKAEQWQKTTPEADNEVIHNFTVWLEANPQTPKP